MELECFRCHVKSDTKTMQLGVDAITGTVKHFCKKCFVEMMPKVMKPEGVPR